MAAFRSAAQENVAKPVTFSAAAPFVTAPYIQLGAGTSGAENVSILWHTRDEDVDWRVETRSTRGGGRWTPTGAPVMRRIQVGEVPAHRVYSASVPRSAGERFEYRLLRGDKSVFSATATGRKRAGRPSRFVVFGDCSQNTPGQRAIAHQVYQVKPDYVMITGDIVYGRGLASEYYEKFFPIYASEQDSAASGAPLLASTLFVAAPGNHDTATPDIDRFPDAQAYFYYWEQPLNGPLHEWGAPSTPPITGAPERRQAIQLAAGPNYPRMANFSFDYGDVHWLVLDSNRYVDWSDTGLREWVRKDLAGAQRARWRFVSYHHPGFNSAKNHFLDQWMRTLCDLFEQGNVDIVFNGHVHNYQRSFPLRFKARPGADGQLVAKSGAVEGEWSLDRRFDGRTVTKPDGVLYLITGGGGAGLYNPELQNTPEKWQPFTLKYAADTHSFTQVDVHGARLEIRQISEEGKELDRFTITK